MILVVTMQANLDNKGAAIGFETFNDAADFQSRIGLK